jgi:hypothetical protein
MSNDDVGEFVARRVEIVVQVDAIQGIWRSVHAFNGALFWASVLRCCVGRVVINFIEQYS